MQSGRWASNGMLLTTMAKSGCLFRSFREVLNMMRMNVRLVIIITFFRKFYC